MSAEIENLRKDIGMRATTDLIMSTAWILVFLLPAIAVILWIGVVTAIMISMFMSALLLPSGQPFTYDFGPIYASIAVLYAVVILSSVLFIVLIYKLIKRRNSHFRRQIFLYEDVSAVIRAVAAKKGINAEADLARLDRTLKETRSYEVESEKSAMLWTVLAAFNILGILYVTYFLLKDFYKHERREDAIWTDISKIMDKCGIKFAAPQRTSPLYERSFALYLILTIISIGLFGIYWAYALLSDPSKHFMYHLQIEEPLLNTLQTA